MALKNTILRPGDTLVITSPDRLSRRKADIETELLWFREQHIRLKIPDLPTTMTDFPAGQEWVLDMANNIIIEVLGTMAEQERLRTGSVRRRATQQPEQPVARWDGPDWPGLLSGRRSTQRGRPGSLPPRRLLSVWNRKIYLLQAGQRKIMVGRQPALHTRKSQTAQGFQPSARLAFAANLKL